MNVYAGMIIYETPMRSRIIGLVYIRKLKYIFRFYDIANYVF